MARILLIEDDESLRDALRMFLEQTGHVVTEAKDGRAGLARFKEGGVDIVLTDLVMPEKEGVELIVELKRLPAPHPKIIAMSGGGRVAPTGYLVIAKAVGADHVLIKPFSQAELSAVVNSILSEKKSTGEA